MVFRRIAIAIVLAMCAAVAVGQQPVIVPQWDVDQKKLEAGGYPLPFVLQAGQRFFTTPYLPYNAQTKGGDGYGEGPNGPRWASRQVFYRGVQYGWPFLRLNGLDSQSCYECHNSIGSYQAPASQGGGFIRKPGTVGGSAGSNSNAYINPGFPNPLTYFVRSPPHTFGTAYTQTLADEMTWELLSQVAKVRAAARAKAGAWTQPVALSAKGLPFGSFRTMYSQPTTPNAPGKLVNCADQCDPQGLTPYLPPAGFTDDMAAVTGVSCDFVIRPFQWKGISSSIRHFARDALDFHFSMQAVEKYGGLDCDLDGKTDEMTLGNVSALTSLVAMTRPPIQVFADDRTVARGRAIFMGDFPGLPPQMCASCHTPSLPLYTAQLFVDNPGVATERQPDCEAPADYPAGRETSGGHIARQSLVSPSNANDHPAYTRIGVNAATGEPVTPFAPATGLPCPRPQGPGMPTDPGYCIDLTTLPPGVPEHVLPRLPRNAGVINVPLFSDLRSHDMGNALADKDNNGAPAAQGTDVAGLCIISPLFLTRPLWGVADTGPWLHDGRALTLTDAILGHGGEAQPVVEAFKSLRPADQTAVVAFLLSLQLPCVSSINCPPVPPANATALMMRTPQEQTASR